MKKHVFSAALVVGLAGAAQAQTSVTLYGLIDMGIGHSRVRYSDDDGSRVRASRTGMADGVQAGGRWGLRGSEALGNGVRAVFVLEGGFEGSTGYHGQDGRLFGRQATLGLADDFRGRLEFGRQTNIASKYLPAIMDPFDGSFGQANAGTAFTSQNMARYDNMVLYQTPILSGFQFGLGYSFNIDGREGWRSRSADMRFDTGNKNPNDRAVTAGLRYLNGPLAAGLSYDMFRNSEMTSPSVRAWSFGVSYDFEVVKLHLGVGQSRDGLFAAHTTGHAGADNRALGSFQYDDGLKVNSYVAGLTLPVRTGKVMASWHMADPRRNPDWAPRQKWEMRKQQVYSIGYAHDLSKRTNLYAYGSHGRNMHFEGGLKSMTAAIGMRHQF